MKTTKNTKSVDFTAKLEKLDREYRTLLARRDMLDHAVADKEAEIQKCLDRAAGIN